MRQSIPFVGVVLLAAFPALRASDLAVNPTRPGAYPTLQAALDAAQPGDRILVEVALPTTDQTIIRKSVTIESADGVRHQLHYLGTVQSAGRILIEAITPGMPLVFRNLDLRFERGLGGDRALVGVRSLDDLHGIVLFDGMSVESEPLRPEYSIVLMDIKVSELWIRNSRIIARDTAATAGCAIRPDNRCSDALIATCRILVIEDSELFGGSANFLRYDPCVASSQAPFGGCGGMALKAETDATVVVRSLFSDGNGGDIQAGPWTVTPAPGLAMPSEFIHPGGFFEAYDSKIERSRDGAVLPGENLARQPAVQLSIPTSPLKLDGNVRPGGSLDLAYLPVPPEPALVLLGMKWSFLRIDPLGFLWIDPASFVAKLVFPTAGTMTLPVPMDAGLVGRPIIGQALLVNSVVFSNPSFVQVRE